MKGKIFPKLTSHDYEIIENNLRSYNIPFCVVPTTTDGRIIFFTEEHLSKLPSNDFGKYIPASKNENYTVCNITVEDILMFGKLSKDIKYTIIEMFFRGDVNSLKFLENIKDELQLNLKQ